MIQSIAKAIIVTIGTLAYLAAFFTMLACLLIPFNMKKLIINTIVSLSILYALFAFLYWQHDPGQWAETDRKAFIFLAILTPGITFLNNKPTK